jgi:3-deoxy-7-phosphoheptulonate synthase
VLVVLESGLSPERAEAIQARLKGLGYAVHAHVEGDHVVIGAVSPSSGDRVAEVEAIPGVAEVRRIREPFKLASRSFHPEASIIAAGDVEFGGPEVILMAGPCAVEDDSLVRETARAVARAGARVLRGGAFKPRTSPYSFQGLGEEGLRILRRAADEFGLQVISEIMDVSQLDVMMRYVDILQIGARNVQNFALLRALGQVDRPVLLKRGMASTIDEWLMSAEYLMAGGNHRVILCERGIRTFETYTRNTLDLSAVPVVRWLSHLPIIVDPSHGVGVRNMVLPMALAAVAAGADGLLIEVHCDPERALCDGQQSLLPGQFAELSEQIRVIARTVGRRFGAET